MPSRLIKWYSTTTPRFYVHEFYDGYSQLITCINPNNKNHKKMISVLHDYNYPSIMNKNKFSYYKIEYKKYYHASLPKSMLRNIPDMTILLTKSYYEHEQVSLTKIIIEGYALQNFIDRWKS